MSEEYARRVTVGAWDDVRKIFAALNYWVCGMSTGH